MQTMNPARAVPEVIFRLRLEFGGGCVGHVAAEVRAQLESEPLLATFMRPTVLRHSTFWSGIGGITGAKTGVPDSHRKGTAKNYQPRPRPRPGVVASLHRRLAGIP